MQKDIGESKSFSHLIDADGKVTGSCRYTSDIQLPGMLIGKGLYSKYPRARIINLDISEAKAIRGVITVITHHDLPKDKHFGPGIKDQQIFAIDDVYYIGDMIAAVAAENEEIAVQALDAIIVEYEPLDGVYDPLEALKPESPLARSDITSNLLDHTSITHGDQNKGFSQSDVLIEHTFDTQYAEHLFLETESVIADWDGKKLTVYASGQHPHGDRMQIADALDIVEDNVRVIYPYIGGGFGGKEDMHIQIQTAALAINACRPVKMVRTRHESMFTHTKRPKIIATYKIGAKIDGSIQALCVDFILDSGPYSNLSRYVMEFAAKMASGPYKIANAQIDGYCVATNNLITGAFRGFGGSEIAYCYEQMMDILAEKLSFDPIELRLKNAIEKNSILATGVHIDHEIGMLETIQKAADAANWKSRDQWLDRTPLPNLRRGLGVASILHEVGMGVSYEDQSRVKLEMTPQGSVKLLSGSADMGQNVYVGQAIIAAQTLGVEVTDVELILPDTDVVPDASTTSATRSTYMVGNATLNAALKIRNSLLEIAADIWGTQSEDLIIEKSKILDTKHPERTLNLAEVAKLSWDADNPLIENGFYSMWRSADPLMENIEPTPRSVFAYATQIAQVLVDIETGKVIVEKIWAAHDVGKALNIPSIQGQIDGGILMGIGFALTEELLLKEGNLQNSSLSEYMVPLGNEIPEIEHIIVEVAEPSGPLGAKGIGEPAHIPTAPAIANAVSDAIGIRLFSLPMTPERVLRKYQEIESD